MAKYIVQHRRGSASQWAEKNTIIPKEGEIVIEIDEENFLHKLKIGDGVHAYADLAYLMAGDEIVTQVLAKAKPRIVTVNLAEVWSEDGDGKYSQTLTLDGITKNSRLDLQPDANMLAEFKQLGLVFVTENNGNAITVYSVGNTPTKAYSMQATIVETECDSDTTVVGIPVGTPVAQPDWNQTDETKADYIKNKPNVNLSEYAKKDEVYETSSFAWTDFEYFADGADGFIGTVNADSIIIKHTEEREYVQIVCRDNTLGFTASVSGSGMLRINGAYRQYEDETFTIPPTYLINDLFFYGAYTEWTFTDMVKYSVRDVSELKAQIDDINSALEIKVDKVEGKGLSTNDYTDDEKTKLANIAEGAEVNIQADWNQTDTTQNDYIKNKPTHVTGGAYEWNYTEENSLGVLESPDGSNLTIYTFDGMPEAVISNIWVIDRRSEGSFGAYYFDIYAKCETDGSGYIEWTTEMGETFSYPLTTEYQRFSSKETYMFSIRCTSTVTLSPIDDPSQAGLVSISELCGIHKDIYKIQTESISESEVATMIANSSHLKRTIVTELPRVGDTNTIYMVPSGKDSSITIISAGTAVDGGTISIKIDTSYFTNGLPINIEINGKLLYSSIPTSYDNNGDGVNDYHGDGFIYDDVAELLSIGYDTGALGTEFQYCMYQGTRNTNIYLEYMYINDSWEQIGSSEVDLTNYVKNTDYATSLKGGVVKNGGSGWGVAIRDEGIPYVCMATDAEIDGKTSPYKPITPRNLEYAVKSVGDGYYATEDAVFEKGSFGWTDFEYFADGANGFIATITENSIVIDNAEEEQEHVQIVCRDNILGFTFSVSGSGILRINGEYRRYEDETVVIPLTYLTKDLFFYGVGTTWTFTDMKIQSIKGIGNIDKALDSILDIQNGLIGGDAI